MPRINLRSALSRGCLTALAMVLPIPGGAQEIALETIVVTAPDQQTDPASGISQSRLGRDGMRLRYQGAGLSAMVADMAGVTTAGGGEDPATALNIRGLQDHGRVAVTIDGARQNFAKSDHGANGSFYLDPEMLRSVTVTRGPGASGAGAIGGAVALTTVRADDILQYGADQGAEVTLRYGDLTAAPTGHIAIATRLGEMSDLLFAATTAETGPYVSGGGQVVEAGQKTDSALLKYSTDIDGGHRFGLSGSLLDKSFETGRAAGNPRQNSSATTSIVADYSYAPGSDVWDLSATIYDTGTRLDQQSVGRDGAGLGPARSYDTSTRGLRIQNRSFLDLWGAEHQLTYGVDTFRDTVSTNDPGASGGSLTPSGARSLTSLFVEDQVAFGDLTVTLGLKHETYAVKIDDGRVSGAKPSPRLALSYAFSDSHSVFASAATGFRPPSLSEALINGLHPAPADFAIRPNPDLRPEQSRNLEFGASLKLLDRFQTGDSLDTRLAVFRNDVQDYIGLEWTGGVFDGFYQYQNMANVRIDGIELELGYDSGRFFSTLTGQMMRGTDRVTGEELSRLAPNRVVLTAGFRNEDQSRQGGLRVTSVAAKTTADFAAGSWTTLDLFLTQEFGQRGTFGLTLNNILDEDYTQHLNTQPSPGFNAKASLSLRF